jgi:hypothetical protein
VALLGCQTLARAHCLTLSSDLKLHRLLTFHFALLVWGSYNAYLHVRSDLSGVHSQSQTLAS